MIPKRINYIWLGGKPKSNFSSICLLSWREHLAGYEIIEWNENNLDLEKLCDENKFLKECRNRKLWAFMADYLRLYVLYNYGGIYMDVDVQVLKNFDDLLDNKIFIGYEYFSRDRDDCVTEGTGVIACEPGNEIIKECLHYYDEEIWNTDAYYIPTILTTVIKRYNLEDYKIYPVTYFAPYDYRKNFNPNCVKRETYAIHWFQGSWHENKQIGLFLQVKHIKNPFLKKIKQAIYMVKYYKHKWQYIIGLIIK